MIVHPSAIAGIQELWRETKGDKRIKIAIIDGPIDTGHPSLREASLSLVCDQDCVAPLKTSHGTHVASIIFGQHDGVIKGLAPDCTGIHLPIFRECEEGPPNCTQTELANAIIRAANLGATVINISAGQFEPSGTAEPVLAHAIHQCRQRGVIVVTAAGNDGCDCVHVPGALSTVIVVGAMDSDGNPLGFSNWGSAYRSSGILAPGQYIVGAGLNDKVIFQSGTSFATAIVSGVIGLLASIQLKTTGKVRISNVHEAILRSVDGCDVRTTSDCRRLLRGRLNVIRATEFLQRGVSQMISNNSIQQQGEPVEASAGENDVMMQEHIGPAPHSEVAASVLVGPNAPSRNGKRFEEMEPAEKLQLTDCGCSPAARSKFIYVLGRLSHDFGTETRREGLNFYAGHLRDVRLNLDHPRDLFRHLLGYSHYYLRNGNATFDRRAAHKSDATELIWVLEQNGEPSYAIRPEGEFAERVYDELIHSYLEQEGLREFFPSIDVDSDESLPDQLKSDYRLLDAVDPDSPEFEKRNKERLVAAKPIDRVAIPGTVSGSVRLLRYGRTVPVIKPVLRGMASWNWQSLLEIVLKRLNLGSESALTAEQIARRDVLITELEGTRDILYEKTLNSGLAGAERAINYVATNLFLAAKATDLWHEETLEGISVHAPAIPRPGIEAYDVEYSFFTPENLIKARRIVAQTIDVTDTVPVPVGELRMYRRR